MFGEVGAEGDGAVVDCFKRPASWRWMLCPPSVPECTGFEAKRAAGLGQRLEGEAVGAYSGLGAAI
ncbi:hypothetical protein CGK93_06180 [Arthrobacter sp. YN]|nr:hypothetical protein CGK93_06180 [Arthrobacter sp. YN]